MRALLKAQGVWDIVENGYTMPEEEATLTVAQQVELDGAQKKDQTALFWLLQAVDDSIHEKIANSATSKEAWDTIEKVFKGGD